MTLETFPSPANTDAHRSPIGSQSCGSPSWALRPFVQSRRTRWPNSKHLWHTGSLTRSTSVSITPGPKNERKRNAHRTQNGTRTRETSSSGTAVTAAASSPVSPRLVPTLVFPPQDPLRLRTIIKALPGLHLPKDLRLGEELSCEAHRRVALADMFLRNDEEHLVALHSSLSSSPPSFARGLVA